MAFDDHLKNGFARILATQRNEERRGPISPFALFVPLRCYSRRNFVAPLNLASINRSGAVQLDKDLLGGDDAASFSVIMIFL